MRDLQARFARECRSWPHRLNEAFCTLISSIGPMMTSGRSDTTSGRGMMNRWSSNGTSWFHATTPNENEICKRQTVHDCGNHYIE